VINFNLISVTLNVFFGNKSKDNNTDEYSSRNVGSNDNYADIDIIDEKEERRLKKQLKKNLKYNAKLRKKAGLDTTRYVVRANGTTYTENP